MSFSGSGGPPPKQAREQGLSGGQKPYGFRFYEKLANGKNKTLQFIGLDRDKDTLVGEKDVKILILDEAVPGDDEWQPSVYIHERFRFNGNWGNYSICRKKTPEGCRLDVALSEKHTHAPWCKIGSEHGDDECKKLGLMEPRGGSWRWACTGIKLKPYTVQKGPNAGKVIPYTRGIILAGEDQYKTLLTYRKAWGGLRGRLFNVSRSDGTFAPRIGDKWDPEGEVWTDEKMMEYFVDAAADYGLDIANYVKAMDYTEILALPTVAQIAETAKWVAGERGIDIDADPADVAEPVAAAATAAAEPEGDSNDLPF